MASIRNLSRFPLSLAITLRGQTMWDVVEAEQKSYPPAACLTVKTPTDKCLCFYASTLGWVVPESPERYDLRVETYNKLCVVFDAKEPKICFESLGALAMAMLFPTVKPPVIDLNTLNAKN